jgi:energy-coupling factor transport system ATP-binding protein
MSRCVIDVQELHHIYGEGSLQAQVALAGVNLTVNAGEIVVLLGSTGSGKSTLLQHLNGILSGNKGRVVVLDQDMNDPATDLRALRQAVGLVFQRPENQLFERYVGDDIAYGPRLAGLQGVALRERVKWAMDVVDLDFEAFKDRSTFTLSGGERRKAGLAGVIALKPQILLLDEPTAGLDPMTRADLLQRLTRLNRDGTTLVIATHNIDEVAVLARRIFVLDRGIVALSGDTKSVLSQSKRLRNLGLDAPAPVLLMDALTDRGWKMPMDAITMTEAEAVILKAAADQRGNAG